MGFFSYDCKECGHPMLSPEATDKGINEWMADAVALTEDERHEGVYDGYGRADDYDVEDCGMEAAWLHRACWEKAGKPGWAHYRTPSTPSGDQGWFFNDGDHDLIDPRIEDEEERARLLAEGVARRDRKRYDQRARKVDECMTDSELLKELRKKNITTPLGAIRNFKGAENLWREQADEAIAAGGDDDFRWGSV